MSKIKILVAYYEMMMGGSTTSLLAFLNCIDKEKYQVDLQLYHNCGALLDQIPEGVRLLPEAATCHGMRGKIVKGAKGLLTGAIPRAYLVNRKRKKRGMSGQVMAEFQAKHLSRKHKEGYDVAIGYMEGWPVHYVAHSVKAAKKLCWLHSTFANLAPVPALERDWMKRVDNIVFVADNCRDDFREVMPDMGRKAVTILNITDSRLLTARAAEIDETDADFLRFRDADCFKIITVCRITISVKGLDRAVHCAKQLKESGRKFLWTIIGDGAELETLRRMISDADLTDCMVAIGSRMNPLPFMKEADVFCMLSRFEGKPMVVTESMIVGTPPFVTRYLSAAEQIEHGVEGVIVENGDDTMFEALARYADRPEAIRQMKAYLSAHNYDNRAYMREIEENYLYIGDNHE